MHIIFHCNNCDARLEIEADSVGSSVECPTCRTPVVVPRKGIEPGTTIGGFRIVRLLGRGGMGEVYLARQLSMERLVALKILSRSLAGNPEAAEAFVREVRLTARLQHPHLVTAYDAGEDAGVLYMAMAYIQGPTLHEWVRKRGALEQGEACRIALKICEALAYAWNEHRLLHRDVKPGNILLDAKGEPHLADLGLAHSILDRTPAIARGPIGTPNYMSPEQADGGAATCRSDIYGLGATLYTMVTGHIPYEARTPEESLRRLSAESLPDPRIFNPSLTPLFVECLSRMLARDPRERWADWNETHQALRALMVGRGPATFTGRAGIHAATDSPPVSAVRPFNGWMLAAGAGVGLLMGAGVMLWMNRAKSPAEATPGPTVAEASPDVTNAPTVAPAPANPEPMWDALQYGLEHPQDATGFQERVRHVAEADRESPHARRAIRRIEEMNRDRDQKADLAFAALSRKADDMASAGQAREAARMLRDYRGDWAEQTLLKRNEKADLLDRQENKRVAFDQLVSDVATALIARDMVAATDTVTKAWTEPESAPDAEQLAVLRTLVTEAAGMDARVLDSFATQMGEEVQVERADGQTENVKVYSVRDGMIRAQRILPEGLIYRDFKPSDLSHAERMRRLAASPGPAAALLQGLSALQANDAPAARAAFQEVPAPLGPALMRALDGSTEMGRGSGGRAPELPPSGLSPK